MKSRSVTLLLTLAAALAALVGGCPQTPDPAGSNAKPKLVPFSSQSEWLSYFTDQVRRTRQNNRFRSQFFGFPGGFGTDAMTSAAPEASGGADNSATSFTTTNIQEAGVDEGDIFKSDGERFYVVRGRTLRIANAVPSDAMAELGKLALDDYISEIYLLDNHKLIVLAQRFNYQPSPYSLMAIEMWPPYYSQAQAVAYLVDVADPANPSVVQKVELDGSRVSSRVVSGRLILVLSVAPDVPDDAIPLLGAPRIQMEDVMPKMYVEGATTGDLVPWSDWLHPESPNGYMMTAVVALDTADLQNILSSVAILASAGTVYSSTEALYVTDTEYDLNDNFREFTAIHKFAFDDKGAANYVASGAVSGRPLNQFSLGEYEGNLRIATHVIPAVQGVVMDEVMSSDGTVSITQATADAAPSAPSNSVYVLSEKDGELALLGAIEGIAPGERLYSSRFMGKRGFLVTFRQIDPLFSLDLSDPAAPRIAGELKIPGFSDYLHPLGDNYLIGVGRSTTTSPWGGTVTKAVQLSLFNVSDLANPTVVQQVEIGGYSSYTEVSQDHKAFAFLPDRNILALPAMLYPADYNPYDGSMGMADYLPPTNTVLFYHVDPATGFTALGQINSVTDSSGYYYYSGTTRPAIIGESAYAVNQNGVRSAPMSNFTTTSTLIFDAGTDDFQMMYFGNGSGGGESSPPSGGESSASRGSTP
ncbi:MAG: beta-propeller domain-containing protein [Planctomycetes bacterium]|nr:beta-propeller domain-containing protein [Planctomycetota bacterium]